MMIMGSDGAGGNDGEYHTDSTVVIEFETDGGLAEPLRNAEETQLNLNGHCFICLKAEQTPGWIVPVLNFDPKLIKSFQSLMCYLTGQSHKFNEDEGGGGVLHSCENNEDEIGLEMLRMKSLPPPPICVQCFEDVAEIHRLHQELLRIQRRIQSQVVRVRNCIAKTVEIGGKGEEGDNVIPKNSRNTLLESLSSSSIAEEEVEMMTNLVVKLHDRIIKEGTSSVLFPSRPPTLPPSDEDVQVVEIDPNPPSTDQEVTILDVEIPSADDDPSDTDGVSPPKKQKVQVEFITFEEYTSGQDHVYISHEGGHQQEGVVEIPFHPEEPDEAQIVIDSTANHTEEVEEAAHIKNTTFVEPPQEIHEVQPTNVSIIRDNSGGVGDDNTAVNIAGIPVDPSANYVMITTNVTDPNTGIVSVQPILISVAQLQQQTSSSTSNTSQLVPTTIQPSGSGPKNKANKREPVGAYSTPSEYVYYQEDFQPCDVCNARISRGSEIASHLATHVGSDYVFYCSDCQLGFISPFRLEQYHRTRPLRCRFDNSVHTGPLFSCDLCPCQSQKPLKFRKHLEDHNSAEGQTKSFQCPLCPLRFVSKRCVEFHLGDKHVFTKPSGRQKCDVCGSFFDLGEIETHLWSHGISDILRCKLCMCIFSSVENIIDHQVAVKRRGLHDISCHVCTSKFIRIRDLRLHYFEEHGLGTKYACYKCKEEFFTMKSYITHQRKCAPDEFYESCGEEPTPTKTNQQPSKPVYPSMVKKECPDCGKSWSTSDILLRHRIKEHGHPPVKCSRPDCNLTFTSESDHRSHVAADHKGYTVITKPFTCDQCGESFQRKDKLKKHKFVKHSDAKPFSCEMCGLTYRNKVTLQSHMNLKHYGMARKKDKKCDVCGSVFFDLQVLKHHKLIHTNERPFTCSTCGQRFRQRPALRAHEKAHAELGDLFKPKGEMGRGLKK